jgi:cell division septation protein DedD
MRALRSTALLAAIACLTAGPSAQSLADLARRTPAPQGTAKTYTNDDVEMAKPVAPSAPAATVPDTDAPAAAKAEATKAAMGTGAQEEPATGDRSEKKKPAEYVVNRIAALKGLLQNKEKQLNDLRARDAKRDVELVLAQIGRMQAELSALESHVAPASPPASR